MTTGGSGSLTNKDDLTKGREDLPELGSENKGKGKGKAENQEKRMLPAGVFILTAIAAIEIEHEQGNPKKHIVQLTRADAFPEISITFLTEAPNEPLVQEIKQKVRECEIILSFLETVHQDTVE
ncbi:uncharacterized protein LOC120643777 isoform X2 [Panicum virgatum]|uniref:Uncharacterized protein n=1 Tax=Panicum virgatum TaxID=38727 RepID=A0A8T0PQX5_PANVG|nr:uncharacterized protein LOC120643763 isoform X2 [Panicum virgatum]XP_039776180.1 uncharacterized protein LOC120643773 isoform X2 [Panicum virgatum]XP_039776184.1 uncharacterized protein LOC120643777 isoform X2 [Panicum virgatum]KAG2560534.1 hypothetical protein PVAP13_8KG098268 [Panicum virgatum]KAG2560547.1 hypothetical protein PVAP13_8KG098652 [Panicum virgatum]